jgi:acetoacetyl-CoA reductase/3-oxoacyl-[acyl-carrier protein] reductase
MSFQGRVSIVTGGTRGIGEAISRRLVGQGAHVVALYVSDHDRARRLVADLAGGPGTFTAEAMDVGDRAACRDLVAKVLTDHGGIDHVVNNAGLLVENSFAAMTEEEWDTAIRINLSGPFFLAQAAIETMIEARYGRIVHIGSITAMIGNGKEIGYGSAKAGLVGMTRSMARAVARKGITVNLVVPGVFETDMTNAMDPADQKMIASMIPVGRRGAPDELAHAVEFLLDDRAGYITGSVVTVDGGISMGD